MARSQSKTMRLLAVMLLGLVTMVVHPSAAAAPAADAPAKIRWVYGQLAPALQNPGDSASRLRAAALPPDADAAAVKAFESGWQQGNTP